MFGWLTHAPPPPILFHVGSLDVRWYGVLMAVALLGGLLLAQWLAKQSRVAPEHILDLGLIATILAVLGARIVHVFDEWSYYQYHLGEIAQFWRGGLAFHGVLAGGILAVWIFCRWRHHAFLLLLDIAMPALALGQVIGRWGNWFNQELYGRATTLPWAIPIDSSHRLATVASSPTFHPLFLYESLGNAVVLALLLLLWHWQGRRQGDVVAAYLILSPLLRFGLDFFRLDQPMVGALTNAQVFSLMLIAAGLALLFTRRQRPVQ